MATSESTTIARSTTIAAPPRRVWELVSDLPSMGEYSPENTGGEWVGGATGPAVGAVFRGRNGAGRRRWSTVATVVRCVPGEAFAFRVKASGLAASMWSYDLEPDGAGCRLTETWTDLRGPLLKGIGRLATGVADRSGFTATSIEQTLQRVKERAERQE